LEEYEYIVIDMPLTFSAADSLVMEKHANEIVFISDGSEAGNCKLQNAIEIMKIRMKGEKNSLLLKTRLFYNCFQPGTAKKLSDFPLEEIGTVGRIDGASPEYLKNMPGSRNAFERFL
jgi:hypothetical protein